jgi:hypothetical protein
MVAFMDNNTNLKKPFNIELQHRRDEDTNWESINPTLKDGEIIIVYKDGDKKLKIGDGKTPYKDLPFIDSALSAKIEELQTTSGLFSNVEPVESAIFTIDISKSSCFIFDNAKIGANTIYPTIIGVPKSKGACFSMILINCGFANVVWGETNTIKWAKKEPPELTINGTDILTFITMNGGEVWYGTPSILNAD